MKPDKRIAEESFIREVAFKNVAGNWQFNGDLTPERVFKIWEEHAQNEMEDDLESECGEFAIDFFNWCVDNHYTKTRIGSWGRIGRLNEHLTDSELLSEYKQSLVER